MSNTDAKQLKSDILMARQITANDIVEPKIKQLFQLSLISFIGPTPFGRLNKLVLHMK